MSIPTEDVFLEDVSASALDRAIPGEGNATTARRIIDAIAGRSPTWLATDPARTWLSVATPLGDYSAVGPSCTELCSYDGDSMAGIPGSDEPSVMHICELDQHIALLVALRETRRRFDDGERPPTCTHDCLTRHVIDGVAVPDQCQCCGKQFGEARPTPPVPVTVAALEPLPEVLVPCPGGQCPHYLYGVKHEHTARAQ